MRTWTQINDLKQLHNFHIGSRGVVGSLAPKWRNWAKRGAVRTVTRIRGQMDGLFGSAG
jgi:hypothetical protein